MGVSTKETRLSGSVTLVIYEFVLGMEPIYLRGEFPGPYQHATTSAFSFLHHFGSSISCQTRTSMSLSGPEHF